MLEFAWTKGQVKDQQTSTRWDRTNGLGIEGDLRGELLKVLPYSTAYDWSREDSYPHTEVYSPAP